MKHVPSIVALIFAVALMFAGNSPTKLEGSPVAADPSPFCECDSCKCVVCNCTPTLADNSQLPPTVPNLVSDLEPPHSLVALTEGQVRLIEVGDSNKPAAVYTQPQVLPVKPPTPPQVLPAKAQAGKPAPPAAVQYGSCGPGGCGVRRGLFGRRR